VRRKRVVREKEEEGENPPLKFNIKPYATA